MANTASSQFPAPHAPALTPDAGRYRASASYCNPVSSGSGYSAQVLIPGTSLLPQDQELWQDDPGLILGDAILLPLWPPGSLDTALEPGEGYKAVTEFWSQFPQL